jgi:hypothetical protein
LIVACIVAGKTVKSDKKQFGRSMHHKVVRQCSIGALGFYLLYRFDKSGEMEDAHRPNFGKNKEWYDIKILTEGTRNNTKKELQRRTYIDPIRKIFKQLKIYSSHFGHWGRVNAPTKLEFEEVSPEYIRILGESSCLFYSCFHFLTFLYFIFYRQLGY